jgi:hypothetical protein
MATVFMLIYERNNPASYWRPLLDLLPQFDDCPLFWKDVGFESLQKSSFTRERFVKKIHHLKRFFMEYLLPTIRFYHEIFTWVSYLINKHTTISFANLLDKQTVTLDDFNWALAVIWSRAYWLDEDDHFPGLIPIADMFNHDCKPSKEFVVSQHLPSSFMESQKLTLGIRVNIITTEKTNISKCFLWSSIQQENR